MFKNLLIQKIKKQNLNIGIIGVGYVGIKLVLAFAKYKNKIYCFDSDQKKINLLKKSISPFSYIKNEQVKKISNYLKFPKRLSDVSNCNIIIICLPTPLKSGKPDLSHLRKSWNQIKNFIQRGQLIILESTTYPGCTEEIYLNFLNKNFIVDKNIFLAYSPERENPGDKNFNFKNTPKIVSGINKNSLILCKKIYSTIVNKVHLAPNIKTAEASKLLENIYRSINIALINELSMACNKLKLNIYDIINLASSKPFGFSKFMPGPGTGGHCIPIDPIYFSWLSKKKGANVKFIKLSAEINYLRTKWIINKIKRIINKFKKKKILLLGLAYKKNIEDTRESASVKIFENLKKMKGISIDFCDPFVKEYKFKILGQKVFIKSIQHNHNSFKKYDLIIIATDHDIFDYKKILNLNKYVVDLRGRLINNKNNNIYHF
jgi:UDP-N-acetyl-D-glucosamine dehydrogenase